MRFLLFLVGGVLVVNSMVLAGWSLYRTITPPYLETALSIDNDCGQNCWFGYLSNGETSRSQVADQIENGGATILNRRGSNMRFTHFDETTDNSIGTISVALVDGYAVTTCFFPTPRTLTIGDMHATFGPPHSFWTYVFSSQIAFEMLYETQDGQMMAKGRLTTDFRDFEATRLGFDIFVSEICTASDLGLEDEDTIRPVERPQWQGFNSTIADYQERVFVSGNPSFSFQ